MLNFTAKTIAATAAIYMATALAPAPSNASTRITGYEAPILQRYIDRAQAPTPAGTIDVTSDVSICPPVSGTCVEPDLPVPLIHWGAEGRLTFYHELGHIAWSRLLGDGDRAAYRQIIGQPDAADEDLSEWFAADYAFCAWIPRGSLGRYLRVSLGLPRSEARAGQRMCSLTRRAGRRSAR